MTNKLGARGQALLCVIVAEIRNDRVKKGDPTSFIPYSEALSKLGLAPNPFAGRRLQYAGLNELNEWTIHSYGIPKVAGLIVSKRYWEPSEGYPRSHGLSTENHEWKKWWMAETDKAIAFDWSPFV